MLKPTLSLAATLCVAALNTAFTAPAVHAQNLFLFPGGSVGNSYTANDTTYQNGNIYAGWDSNFAPTDSMGNPYVATLNVSVGGSVNRTFGFNTSTVNISGGSVYEARSFNTSTTTINSGSVGNAYGRDTGTLNISGGSVFAALAENTSTVAISGGSVTNVYGYDTGTLNISGGSVFAANGFSTSTTNISGGTLPNGFILHNSGAKVNFVGTGLSFAYQSYGFKSTYAEYADFFQVSGTIGGATKTYDVYIRNANGASGTPNSTPRQFSFNGVPVVVPEAGTLVLFSSVVSLVGAAAVRRARKAI